MTELVFVPKRQMRDWLNKGWGIVHPSYYTPSKWAVLMYPPGWVEEDKPQRLSLVKEDKP